MPGKPRRHFDDVDRKALLDALEAARRVCVQANRKTPIRGEVYLASEKVMHAIEWCRIVCAPAQRPFTSYVSEAAHRALSLCALQGGPLTHAILLKRVEGYNTLLVG